MLERIKIWMNKINISQTNLAENIGVNKATISHIMSGRNKPSIDFFIKLNLSTKCQIPPWNVFKNIS